MEIEEQLRSESDQLLDAIDQLRAVEAEKRAVPPSSGKFQKLAREVERLADTVVSHAEVQSDLGAEAAQASAASGEAAKSIDETPRDVTTILAEWRAAERRAQTAALGSDESARARADVERLRDEYQHTLSLTSRRKNT